LANTPQICRLCQAAHGDFEVVGDFVYGGQAEQKFYRCPDCDIAFLFPPTNEEEEAQFYAQEFEKFMEGRAGENRDWTGPEAHIASNQDQVSRRLPFLEQHLGRPGVRLLELGCSSGFMLLPLKERGVEVMGVEPSGLFTNFVRSRDIPVYESLEDFESQSGAAGELNLVTHYFLLEHVRDPLSFLNQCLDLLKPDGTVFFEVPSRDDPLVTIYDIPAFHKFYWSVAHHWYFNQGSLKFLLDQLPCEYEMIPDQRYDLSNHMWWAMAGQPGGMGKFSAQFSPELDEAYKESMRRTGHCDTFFVRLHKGS
jgi:SAM-dependent methyltransferase